MMVAGFVSGDEGCKVETAMWMEDGRFGGSDEAPRQDFRVHLGLNAEDEHVTRSTCQPFRSPVLDFVKRAR